MITGNAAACGGAISCISASSATIVNNVIVGNTSSSLGGGIYASSCSPTLTNNTITDNTASSDGGGIYCFNSSLAITNTIVAFNSSGIYGGGGSPAMRSNCVYGNTMYDYLGIDDPTATNGNISADPQLADASYGHWHIQWNSPCVDAGNDSAVPPGGLDFDGQARTQGLHVDIGADESDGTAWPVGENAIVRVSPAGNDANDGSSWAAAKRTVQGALDTAQSGDYVWVAAGTYVETITLKAGVALYGGFVGDDARPAQRDWTVHETILDGNHVGSVVTSPPGLAATTRIDGFTIRNGSGTVSGSYTYGGGIYCTSSSPTITNNTITANALSGGTYCYGGGVYCDSSSPTITGNTITANILSDGSYCYGGGIYCSSSSPMIANNTISGNSAVYGGGICCSASSPTIADDTIVDNTGGFGGGIYCCSSSSPTITNSTIAENSVSCSSGCARGGGVYCTESSPVISNNTIVRNRAFRGCGGGIACGPHSSPTITANRITGNTVTCAHMGYDGSLSGAGAGVFCGDYAGMQSPTIANNTIAANSAELYGGGIGCFSGSKPTITSNVITGNGARFGGGVYCDSSYATITNDTIAGNTATDGGGVYCKSSSLPITNTIIAFNSSGVYSSDGSPTLKSNCVYANARYNCSGFTDPTGVNGNITADPNLADLRYGNTHIQPSSPCRDAGDGSAVQAGWLDMDGQGRIQGSRVDIGADEGDGTAWPTGPYVIVRVSPDGDDANAGSSWAEAKRTVQAGIDAAGAAGGEVWVEAGTYLERIRLCPYVHMYGGFNGTESAKTQRDFRANVTILDGQRDGSVVTADAAGHDLATIDGFTIRNGTGSLPDPWTDSLAYSCGYGGGMYCQNCSPRIADNTIVGNAAVYGGGIFCRCSCSMIANNTIVGNAATVIGGGVYCEYSSPTLAGNTIAGNTARSGGGIHCEECASPVIANTIIAFNSSGIFKSGGNPVLKSNCVYGNGAQNYSGLTDPTGTNGNISADPRLADWQYGNWHIQPGSPCVDAGDDSVVQPDFLDMDSRPRTQGGHVDIGADESDNTVWPEGPDRIVRISPDGNDANDGSTWTLTKRTVQAGIDAASVRGGEVWVKAGTYPERIALGSLVHMYGGFVGAETTRDQRDVSANATVLDGRQDGPVITVSAVCYGLGTIDGFTVTNGKGINGGGIYCSWSSLTIKNNTITGNTATCGGGICCDNHSSPTIAANTIAGNTASSAAGGIYCSTSSPTIVNNAITGNTAPAGSGIWCGTSPAAIVNNRIMGNTVGGGIYCDSSDAAIVNNAVVGNAGSGISLRYSDAVIVGNIIAANRGVVGAGLCCYESEPTVTNSTIVANAASSDGGAIYWYDSWPASPVIANTIIAFNSSGVYRYSTSRGAPSLQRSCVYGNTAYNYSGLTDPTGTNGNLSADPLFVRNPSDGGDGWDVGDNDDYGDLRLRAGSSCIDAGDNAAVPPDTIDLDGDGDVAEPLPFDVAGRLRFVDDFAAANVGVGGPAVVDIGAYERYPDTSVDFDRDGDVDMADFQHFRECMNGANRPYASGCEDADYDDDTDVDLLDFARFRACFNGSNRPTACR